MFLDEPTVYKYVGASIVIPEGCYTYEDPQIQEDVTFYDCVFSCMVE